MKCAGGYQDCGPSVGYFVTKSGNSVISCFHCYDAIYRVNPHWAWRRHKCGDCTSTAAGEWTDGSFSQPKCAAHYAPPNIISPDKWRWVEYVRPILLNPRSKAAPSADPASKPKCNCPFSDLIRYGCKCGGC